MKIHPNRKWEVITENEYQDTCRMRVPCGWLIRERIFTSTGSTSVSIIFMRDGSGDWVFND